MDPLAIGALAISLTLAVITFVNWVRDRVLYESNNKERRDSLVVDSAEKAVAAAEKAVSISDRLLHGVLNDNESLRNRVRELEAQVKSLETTVLELKRISE